MRDRIELKPDVCAGQPVVRGTRVSVATVLGYLSAGDTVEDVLAAHPRLTREDVLASIDYARRVAEARSVVRVAS